jgi:glycosyltransferase involved in cell wall biosynthesis
VRLQSVAVVAIGRNEGLRLQKCLESALAAGVAAVVYVDSGSTDDSVAMATAKGCAVVCLDMAKPFTAARARNEGLKQALLMAPDVRFVQFVDGDCEFSPGWLETAGSYLVENPKVAVVCGRRRERHPENSPYNSLCDVEWNTPIGVAMSCGGDAMMRVDAFLQAVGYKSNLIAGEEPELCVRLRKAGWTVWRIDHEMTLHDAALLHFSQWWKRSKRAGHAYFEGAALHGGAPEYHWVKETRRSIVWGGVIPLVILISSIFISPLFALLLLVYPLQMLRIYFGSKGRFAYARWYAVLMVLGKFAEFSGGLQYWKNRLAKRTSAIIEYK